MAKVNREFIPAVTQVVTPAKEVFHLELTPEEMALIYLLVGNCRGAEYRFYTDLKEGLGFKEFDQSSPNLESKMDTIVVGRVDIQNLLSKRQK